SNLMIQQTACAGSNQTVISVCWCWQRLSLPIWSVETVANTACSLMAKTLCPPIHRCHRPMMTDNVFADALVPEVDDPRFADLIDTFTVPARVPLAPEI